MVARKSKKGQEISAKEIRKLLENQSKSDEDEREDYAELKALMRWLQSLTEEKDTRKKTKADKYF